MPTVSDDVENCLGVLLNDAEKNPCAALRGAPSLFPVTERSDANAHESRELSLRQAVAFPQESDVGLAKGEDARWTLLAPQDGSALTDAFKQLFEQFLLHGYSVSMILRRAAGGL